LKGKFERSERYLLRLHSLVDPYLGLLHLHMFGFRTQKHHEENLNLNLCLNPFLFLLLLLLNKIIKKKHFQKKIRDPSGKVSPIQSPMTKSN
jgi:hypothetical protein